MSEPNGNLATGIDAPKGDLSGNTSDTGSGIDAASGNTTNERPRFSFINPADIGSEGSGGNSDSGTAGRFEPKRRGRKPGSGNKKATQTLHISGLTEIIVNTHAMLAAFTKTAELEIEQEEAAKLAEATANVSRHYNVAVAAKTVDWINFATVAGMIYGTRMAAIRNRHAQERKANPQPPKASKGNATDLGWMETFNPDMSGFSAQN